MSRVTPALMLLKARRVDPCVRDHDGQTARSLVEMKLHTGEMDAYEMYLSPVVCGSSSSSKESRRCRKQQLPPLVTYSSRGASNKYFKSIIQTYIFVAMLIATVTFAAAFTMPGGYDQQRGIALDGNSTAFKIFVISIELRQTVPLDIPTISNTIVMCSSMLVVFCFIWAWRDPVQFKVNQLTWGHRLTVLACLGMLVSLMTAVFITVAPTSRWPAYVVIAIGANTPVVVFLVLGREAIDVPM
ncbi:hypothetical protein EJB05_04664, partial [Eragrostis curvula]